MKPNIKQAVVPEKIYLDLGQHLWRQHIKVSSGDTVLKGSLVVGGDHPLHASTSGTIVGISKHPSSHRHTALSFHLVIQSDGLDEWQKTANTSDPLTLSPWQLVEKIRIAGVSGLGGGGYPSASKIRTAQNNTPQQLIINAIECEPEISADEAIMLAAPIEILKAALATMRALTLNHFILAIADDKPNSIQIMRSAIKSLEVDEQIKLVVVSADFPNGSERQLIKILLGIAIPGNSYPAQNGIVCLNVSTMYAIYQAIYENKALVERVLTVREDNKVQNFRVHLGTPARELFQQLDNATISDKIRRGGPLTGWLQSSDASVEKGTTGLQAPVSNQAFDALPCIRCAKCSDICPENLLPQELLWYSQPINTNRLETLGLSVCLECGLCESVCPSHIPLTNVFRDSKHSVHEHKRKSATAQKANTRVLQRQLRISNSGDKAQSQREKRMNRLKQKSRPHGEHKSDD